MNSLPLSSVGSEGSDDEERSLSPPHKKLRRGSVSAHAVGSSDRRRSAVSDISNSSGSDDDSDHDSESVAESSESQRQPGAARPHASFGERRVDKVKVYLMQRYEESSYDDLLNKNHEFSDSYPCRVNENAWWYGQRQTRSRPTTWKFISEGTGIAMDNENAPNIGEHWAYFIERNNHLFVVTFGRTKLLEEEFIDPTFGERVIRNISAEVRTEQRGSQSGRLVAILPNSREHEILGKSVKGNGYCQLTRSTALRELPLLCLQLLEIAESGIGEAYQDIHDHLRLAGDMSRRGIGPLREGESVTVDGKIYIKFFERLHEVDSTYLAELQEFVLGLMDEDLLVPELDEHHPPEDEGAYNKRVAQTSPDQLLLMDQREVSGTEVCDLFQFVRTELIHVKLVTKGDPLNHLFGQGNTSADLLMRNRAHRLSIPMVISRLALLDMIRDRMNTSLEPITEQLNRDLLALFELHQRLRRRAELTPCKISGVSSIPTEKKFGKYGDRTLLDLADQTPDSRRYRNLFLSLQRSLAQHRYTPLRDKINRVFKGRGNLGDFLNKVQALLDQSNMVIQGFVLPIAELEADYQKLVQFVAQFNPENTTVVYAIGVPQDRLSGAIGSKRVDLIPLGPRINLRTYAMKIRQLGYQVRVQYIPSLRRGNEVEESAVPPAIPYNARTASQDNAIARDRRQQRELAPEGQRIENLFARQREIDDAPLPPPEQDRFDHPITTGEAIIAYRQLNVFYPQGTGSNGVTLFNNYILSPTLEDGNCFFHACLTEEGMTRAIMGQRTSQIRGGLVEAVMGNPEYQMRMRREILAEYKAPPYRSVPERIRRMLKQNDRRERLRVETIDFLRDKYMLEHPGEPYNENDPSQVLPAYLLTIPYSEEHLLAAISDEEVRSYMDRYTQNRGRDSYITIPGGHGETAAIGAIIAEQQGILVHCFMFNRDRKVLTYKGAIGNPAAEKIVNILYHSNHYWALYNVGESELRRRGVRQVARNYEGH